MDDQSAHGRDLIVTRRAPRMVGDPSTPGDPLPKLLNESAGLGDCSMCGVAVRSSGWDIHWDWHHHVTGFGFPEGYVRGSGGYQYVRPEPKVEG